MKKGIVFLLILSFKVSLYAQYLNLGSWNIVNIKYTYNSKRSYFAEAQLRSLRFYEHFHYYEFKAGVNYEACKNLRLTLAVGSYQTYREEGNFKTPKNNNEFRLWPQVLLTQPLGAFKIEQRYRAEFRFTSNGYRNRFRYRLGLAYPFGNSAAGFKPFSISASNELLFTDSEPFFERNRILLALSYKPTKLVSAQLGYLHQFDYKINDETGRDFLQVGIFIELLKNQLKK